LSSDGVVERLHDRFSAPVLDRGVLERADVELQHLREAEFALHCDVEPAQKLRAEVEQAVYVLVVHAEARVHTCSVD